ncbi:MULTISPECIES: hypothetical protein [unclassified Bradyrhizobium]|uniref:hypothetical protein n=1 Tax=unclassified Bradyrhizobium TaxID=2631580 RepID=UPI0028E4F8BF|nr:MULTISPECIES: hypothetical protein [unclassified Bradyrhizobium]
MPKDQAKGRLYARTERRDHLVKAARDLQSADAATRYDILAETITRAYRAFT